MAIRRLKPAPKNLPKSKPSTIVYNAIDALRGMSGASLNQITKYIAGDTLFPQEIIDQHVKLAIKRGMDYGYIKKTGTLYTVHHDDEETEDLMRAHRRRRSKKVKSVKSPKRRRSSKRHGKRHMSSFDANDDEEAEELMKSHRRRRSRKAKSVKSPKRRRSSKRHGKRHASVKRVVRARKSVSGILQGPLSVKSIVKRRKVVDVKGRKAVVKRGVAVKKAAVKRRR